jgi:hypothetical protein
LLFVAASALLVAAAQPAHGQAAPALVRFLARGEEPPVEYRALRHLEAHNAKFNANAWMNAWTEYDATNGFRFAIAAEGGNGYVRKRVLLAALEAEQKMWDEREPQRASLTPDNYLFGERTAAAGELVPISITPRRKDVLLVDGAIFVVAEDGDLRRIEGRLSKAPSMWTRRVEIRRQYERIAGVRVPVAIESEASVLLAGRSTFRMTYEYETVNGTKVGSPRVIVR